ncbi:histidine phosphatase family protein [Campylobacterota bacterium DY0563]
MQNIYLLRHFKVKDKMNEKVEAKPFFKTKLKFKKMFWLISARFFWYFNLTKYETKKDTINRAKALIESIDKEDKDILIISHGLFLKILEKELKKIGFKSTLGLGVKNSTIYKLERENEYTNHRL